MKVTSYPYLRASLFLGLLFLISSMFPHGRVVAESLRNGGKNLDVPHVIYQARWVEGGSPAHVSPPAGFLQGQLVSTATITVVYQGDWSVEAKSAFEYAVQIWETQLSSSVPIVVIATWDDLTAKYGNPSILGSAGAYDYMANFSGGERDTWYPMALANKLAGSDLNGQEPEIEANFNSNFRIDNHDGWYYGTDGQVSASHWDLVSVVLHELGHGMGFIGSMSVSGNTGWWGVSQDPNRWPFIYDRFVVNGSGQSLIGSFTNGSTDLGSHLRGGSLFFNGTQALAANSQIMPQLYAPKNWMQGSSYSHLDENIYPTSNQNALMTPTLQDGEWIHSPGPIVLGIFSDMGWNTTVIHPTPTRPTPTAGPYPPPTITDWIYLPSINQAYPKP